MSRRITLDDLKDGVSIMSIEARYIYGNQEYDCGYNTSVFWGKDRKVLPRKLYKVKMPYSLGVIHWLKMENIIFDVVGDKVYSNDIVNVTFDKSSKTVSKDKDGQVKCRPRIKIDKKRKYRLEIVEELKTDKKIDELMNEVYPGFMLDGEKYVQFMRTPGKARTRAILFISKLLVVDS